MKKILVNWKLNIVDVNNAPKGFEAKELDVTLPGDITDALIQNDLIEDIHYGDNYLKYRWINNVAWEYTAPLYITEDMLEEDMLYLHFEGIDTFADIYVNNQLLCQTENMFLAYDVQLKDNVRVGENQIRVVIKPVDDFCVDCSDRYGAAFRTDRMLIRKAQCHFGWDWAPEYYGSGIWQPVSLIARSERSIEWVRVRTHTDGTITFFPELNYSIRKPEYQTYKDDKLRIRVFDGDVCVAFQEFAMTGYKNLCNVCIPNPKLWYPNGSGEAAIYRYTVEIVAKDGYTVDVYHGTFGIREVKFDQTPKGRERLEFRAYINGSKVFLKGSNWVPASFMTGAITEERYRKLLILARDAGYNVLRVWGGGIYEQEIFYRLCDEYGILVWQDFMFACGDIPDDNDVFCRLVEKEAVYQVRRLCNHPCMLLWNGGNEIKVAFAYKNNELGKYLTDYLLAGICASYTDIPYFPASPWSYTDFENDITSGEVHRCALFSAAKGVGMSKFRKYIVKNKTITTECAALGPCRVRNLKKFIPEDKLWPINDIWQLHFVCNPYEPQLPPSFAHLELDGAEDFFGEVNGLNDFVKKAMLVHAEMLESEVDYSRADEAFCGGIMNWMYNDIWRNGTWSVVDYDFGCKPAYYAMKRAFALIRLGIVLREEDYVVFLSNHTNETIQRKVCFGQRYLNGELLFEKEWVVDIPAGGVAELSFDEEINTDASAYLFARTETEQTVVFINGYRGVEFTSDVSVEIIPTGMKEHRFTGVCKIKSHAFTKAVFIDAKEEFDFLAEDNYFDMEMGDEREIPFSCANSFTLSDIKVQSFADEWTE
ncbi:MAG: hypothetical protein IJA54_09990 [Tyzzerella sp.]|nr:hypothetical protein [Tyzzerella sp.]